MGENKIRVLVIDDHPIPTKVTRALLDNFSDIEIVGTAINGVDAVELNRELNPDVLLVDLHMPGMDGVEVIRRITADRSDAKILVLTSFAAIDAASPAHQSGVLVRLLNDTEPETLVNAIRQIHHGGPSPKPGNGLTAPPERGHSSDGEPVTEPLTDREHEVLRLVAKGAENRKIAEQLVITEATVRTHISSIMSKLNLTNRVQAALYALREGLVGLNDGDEDL